MKEKILEALSNIIDPDFKKDIVSLGFVKNIVIEEGKNGSVAKFDIELTTPACPVKDEFKAQATELVSALEGISDVQVNMTAPSKKVFNPETANSGIKNVKSFIAISSCKGGVGKSTVAASLAKELSTRGYKVGLLDADIYGPSVPTLFGINNTKVKISAENKIIPEEHEGLKLVSFGFLVGDAPAVIRGPIVTNYIKQLVHQTEWGELDYLFIDMPPGTGDVQLTLTQTLAIDGAVIVTTPHGLSLADVGKGILMFEKVSVPVLGVVENMSFFPCPDNGKNYSIFGENAAEKLKDRFGAEILGKLPIGPEFDFAKNKEVKHPAFASAVDNIIRAIGKGAITKAAKPSINTDDEKITIEISTSFENSNSDKSNAKTYSATNKDLRYWCNSAKNVHEYTGVRMIKREDVPKDIKAEAAQPLGNYAISIDWNDGHKSIIPYEYFIEVAEGTVSDN